MSSELSCTEKAAADFEECAHSESGVVVDDPDRKAKEKALVRKLDLFIAPVMMLLQLISYLDRGNIGFAATQGMTVDIHLKGTNLNVCSPSQRTDSCCSDYDTNLSTNRLPSPSSTSSTSSQSFRAPFS